MTYQKIHDFLKTTAESLFASEYEGSGLFIYGIRSHQQQQYGQPMPQIHVDPFRDTLTTDRPTQAINITIGFLDQDTANSSPEQQMDIHFRMEALSRLYFGLLSDEDSFSELTITRVFLSRHSQAILSGVACTFTLNTPAKLC